MNIQKDQHQEKRILDIGCADGSSIGFKWKNLGFSFGIDIDYTMIKDAHSLQIDNAVFIVASSEKLPFRDQVFDIVISRINKSWSCN